MVQYQAASSLADFLMPVTSAMNSAVGTAKEGEAFLSNNREFFLLFSQIMWAAFLVPAILGFIDALRRPEHRFPHSTGSSKTFWVIALGACFVFTVGWLVTPFYLFMVFLPARKLDPESTDPRAPRLEAPERPFK